MSSVREPVDHDFRGRLTRSEYLHVKQAAVADGRSMTGYVRALVRRDMLMGVSVAGEAADSADGVGRARAGAAAELRQVGGAVRFRLLH